MLAALFAGITCRSANGVSHSSGTSRPSLNWSGSSTSNRCHLLLISRLTLHFKWDAFVRERFHRRLGYEMLATFEDAARETSQQKAESFPFRGAVFENDADHCQDAIAVPCRPSNTPSKARSHEVCGDRRSTCIRKQPFGHQVSAATRCNCAPQSRQRPGMPPRNA